MSVQPVTEKLLGTGKLVDESVMTGAFLQLVVMEGCSDDSDDSRASFGRQGRRDVVRGDLGSGLHRCNDDALAGVRALQRCCKRRDRPRGADARPAPGDDESEIAAIADDGPSQNDQQAHGVVTHDDIELIAQGVMVEVAVAVGVVSKAPHDPRRAACVQRLDHRC